MVLDIIQIGDPILEKPTKKIEDIQDKKVQRLIGDMFDTMIELKSRSAGVSANQVGKSLRICICRRTDLEDALEGLENTETKKGRFKNNEKVEDEKLWEIMINPEITSKSKEKSIFWEGCLSIGVTSKDTIFGPVSRPDKISVKYIDRNGNEKSLEANDFFAHVVQHEIDHLDGILFLGKVPNPSANLWKSPDLDEYINRHKKYPPVR